MNMLKDGGTLTTHSEDFNVRSLDSAAASTVSPGSSDPFYVATYYIKWVTTSCARNFW